MSHTSPSSSLFAIPWETIIKSTSAYHHHEHYRQRVHTTTTVNFDHRRTTTASNSPFVAFFLMPTHTAEALSKVLVECVIDWNIDRKLSTITLDNCSTNDALVGMLLNKLDCKNMSIISYEVLCSHFKFNCSRWFECSWRWYREG
uniref:Uncharacterized protein LOC113786142 n=1 Tax=Cicer arietinum TaxID=3827 RepID=A0A3Q7XXZ1_CICAR|nr:uncharacterized protein LOC113786142 [Cicer arietinum]